MNCQLTGSVWRPTMTKSPRAAAFSKKSKWPTSAKLGLRKTKSSVHVIHSMHFVYCMYTIDTFIYLPHLFSHHDIFIYIVLSIFILKLMLKCNVSFLVFWTLGQRPCNTDTKLCFFQLVYTEWVTFLFVLFWHHLFMFNIKK